jgi:Asp-tRNA(Asn)/Glu-tRNA(Gln) amidotransferase A subunit family amidase
MSRPHDYEACDALELAERVRNGDVTPEELLDAAIARVEARNPDLNAVVLPFYDEARAAIAEGLPDGPLRGVPFLLKDLHLHLAGARLSFGSRFFKDFVSDHDSEIVARYKRAGLVVFGRTASPEFGLSSATESTLYGQTRNPWNLAHTAGGSSGGAAAAVAAGIIPSANASDGGGSIRIPAACCGLFGLKPTRARTPLGPDQGDGWSGMSTVHALTRSVRDSAALLDATHGPDVGDPYWAPPPARPFLEEVGAPPGRLRIALQTEAFNGVATHPDCVAAAEDAARLCEELGHELSQVRLPVDGEALGEATRVIVASSLRSTLEDRAKAIGREFTEDDIEWITFVMATSVKELGVAAYPRSLRVIHAAGRQVARFLQQYDVLLTPTMATPPLELGKVSLANPDLGEFATNLTLTTGYTQLFNASGNPAMSVPLFWNTAGLPIGVQFAGRFGDEATLFRLAAQLENARPWSAQRP